MFTQLRTAIRLRAIAHQLNHRRTMASSTTVHNDNVACCTIPPAASDYQPVGKIEKYAGITTYLTGDKDSKTALVCVFDIFGQVSVVHPMQSSKQTTFFQNQTADAARS
jgi:hypothetical protein